MKRLFFLLTCISGLYLFCILFTSCASNNVTGIDSNESVTEDSEQTLENNTVENIDDKTAASVSDSSVSDSSVTEPSAEEEDITKTAAEMYPELETIQEPQIITLEPSEFDEQTNAKDNIELVQSELPAQEDNNAASQTNKSKDEKAGIKAKDDSENDSENTSATDEDLIDITDDDASAKEQEFNENEEIIPSRKVTLKIYEYLDVTYPGTGWSYMGLTDNSKDLSFFGRTLGTKDSKFTLQARKPGVKIIHFYKEDLIKKVYIDDYIEVTVLNEKGNAKTHIAAPAYKQALPKKARQLIDQNNQIKAQKEAEKTVEIYEENSSESTADKEVKSAIKTDSTSKLQTASEPESVSKIQASSEPQTDSYTETVSDSQIDEKALLKEAQLLYNEKEYKVAKDKIEAYLAAASKDTDEALFLKGQILEAKSEIQNIKAALEAYTALTKNYPESRFWDDANKRIIYLKRFYLEVR